MEAGIVACGSSKGVMSGTHYNRAVRAHKTMYEALHRVLWTEFEDRSLDLSILMTSDQLSEFVTKGDSSWDI